MIELLSHAFIFIIIVASPFAILSEYKANKEAFNGQ